MNTLYNQEVLNQDGTTTTLESYKGKVLLIVNTATGCGFTPQYEGLEALYEEYKDKGFEVLDFPCNQFKEQTPGDDKAINEFCSLKYNTTFKRFKKTDVNGENEAPVFAYLKSKKAPTAPRNEEEAKTFAMLRGLSGAKDNDIVWNFTKFLVDREGNVVERFEPTYSCEEIKSVLVKYL